MNKKCYAYIKTGQETMETLSNILESCLGNPEKGIKPQAKNAYKACREIKLVVDKFRFDFQGTDPDWKPDKSYSGYRGKQTVRYTGDQTEMPLT